MAMEINILVSTPAAQHRSSLILTVKGLSLRELIHEFKYQTLVLFKCCLLQPKVLSSQRSPLRLLTDEDAFLRLAVRTIMHDAVLVDLPHTGSYPKSSRLRGPRAGQL